MSRALVRSFAKASTGTIAILAGLVMMVLFGAIGLATTYTIAIHELSAHQQALDAAVLAGASAPDTSTDAERIAIAEAVFAANLKKGGFSQTSLVVSSSSSAPMFLVAQQTVRGQSLARAKNYFAGIIGSETMDVSVMAEARVAVSAPICVLALDRTSPQGIEIYGTAKFTAQNCAAQSNSADGLGMRQYGTATGHAKQFGVKGNFSGDGFFPAPVTGVPQLDDPYAAVPVPATGPCVDIASKLQNTPAVLSPGTYCGGIRIMANSEIIMEPGVYVMLDGPFRVDSNSTVRGTEVVVAFTGIDSTLYLGSGAIIDLTSPRSGTYMNMQFFQDKDASVDEWVTIMGDVRLTFDGVLYFPTQDVWIGGGSVINAKSPTYILVAQKLWFQDNSVVDVVQENSRGLDIETPAAAMTKNATLVN